MATDFTLDDDPTDLPPRTDRRGNVVRHPRMLDAARKEELRKAQELVQQQIEAVMVPELTSSTRIEKLLALNTTIIMSLLKEALADNPDLDRSIVCSRALVAVKDTVAMIKIRNDMESVDSFNPRSPKFGIVFGWFCEMIQRVLSEHADETTTTNFFNDLVAELSGWEDRIERQFKGVSGKALGALQSPFVEDMREKIRDSSMRAAYLESLEEQIARAEQRLAHLNGEIVAENREGGLT